jgi:hypothetical protein
MDVVDAVAGDVALAEEEGPTTDSDTLFEGRQRVVAIAQDPGPPPVAKLRFFAASIGGRRTSPVERSVGGRR